MLRWGGLKGRASFVRSSNRGDHFGDVPKNWPVSGAHPLLLAYFFKKYPMTISPENPHWSPLVDRVAAVMGPTYQDRPLVLPDTPIEGGIVYYNGQNEAVVVDPTPPYMDEYEMFYEATKCRAQSDGVVRQDMIFRAAAITAMRSLRCSKPRVNKLVKEYAADFAPDLPLLALPVNLGYFLRHGYGVCRHLAPATGWVLERLMREGYAKERQVSIDASDYRGSAHCWVRVTPFLSEPARTKGDITIIDGARETNNPVFTLHEAQKRGYWPYARPSDANLPPSTR